MQRATRSNADNTLVHVEDPEQIIRAEAWQNKEK